MNRNESNAALRKTADVGVFDADSQLVGAQTFSTASGECVISLDGTDPPIAAAGDGICKSTGLAHYVASQAETNVNVDFVVYFRRKARIDLATKTTNCTTKIRAKLPGESGNLFTLAWVQSGAVSPTTGTLTHSTSVDPVSGATLTNYVYTFKDGVSTTANFEATIAASADIDVDVIGAAATLHTIDVFAASAFTGGLRDASVRQVVDQSPRLTAADIQNAVWLFVSEGSIKTGDALRLITALVAGKSSGYISGNEVFSNPAGTKIRATYTVDDDGRSVPTLVDLT